jgi:hypothetical protein
MSPVRLNLTIDEIRVPTGIRIDDSSLYAALELEIRSRIEHQGLGRRFAASNMSSNIDAGKLDSTANAEAALAQSISEALWR